MFERDRSDRIALIVFLASLLAICFVAFISQKPVEQKISAGNTTNIEQNKKDNIQQPIATQSDFNFWEDSAAQWLAALFSVVATIASIKAVFLLRDSLKATHDAVQAADDAVAVTREIGQAQTRAWVSYENIAIHIDASDDKIVISLKFVWSNSGNTPAMNTTIKWFKIVTPMNFTFDQFSSDQIPTTSIDNVAPIGPGKTTYSGALPLTAEDIAVIVNGYGRVLFASEIVYETVFASVDGPRKSSACVEMEIIGISPGQTYTAENLKLAFNCKIVGPFNFVT